MGVGRAGFVLRVAARAYLPQQDVRGKQRAEHGHDAFHVFAIQAGVRNKGRQDKMARRGRHQDGDNDIDIKRQGEQDEDAGDLAVVAKNEDVPDGEGGHGDEKRTALVEQDGKGVGDRHEVGDDDGEIGDDGEDGTGESEARTIVFADKVEQVAVTSGAR